MKGLHQIIWCIQFSSLLCKIYWRVGHLVAAMAMQVLKPIRQLVKYVAYDDLVKRLKITSQHQAIKDPVDWFY